MQHDYLRKCVTATMAASHVTVTELIARIENVGISF